MNTPRPRVLIIGGSRSHVPSIRSAREAGFETLVLDPDPGAPGLAAADIGITEDLSDANRLLARIQEQGGVSGIVSIIEAGVLPAAELSERLGLPTIGRAAAVCATSLAAMRRRWSGIPYSVGFAVASTPEEAIEVADAMDRYPLVLRPDRSPGGSRRGSVVERREQTAEAFALARAEGFPRTDVVIEPAIEGSEHSCETLIDGGRTSVLCIGRKVRSRDPHRVDCSVQYPSPFSHEQRGTIDRMCAMAVSAIGLNRGVAHIEFVYTTSGPVLMDLRARCGGGHTPQIAAYVSGVHVFLESCRMACGLDPRGFTRKDIPRSADYRFLVFPPGTVKSVTVPAYVRNHPAVVDIDVMLRPGDRIGPLRTAADHAGFAVVLGKDLKQTSDLADWACSQVVMQYEDGSSAPARTAEQLRAI